MSESNQEYVQLKNGVKVPILGLGTTHHGGYVHDSVVYALRECGYRHIDTAKRYGVERFLAHAIKESGLDRSELFLTTKLWPKDYGSETTRPAAMESLKRLGTDYLDLYMLHWPVCPNSVANPRQVLEETWRSLELMLDSEVCRSIGVSNFQETELLDLMENASVIPHVNQCEFHPYQNPQSLRKFCQENGIAFEGHCPLAKGRLLTEPTVVQIAEEVGQSPAQVLIRWSIQNGVIAIPKSTKPERLRENFQSLNFNLPESAMLTLNTLHKNLRIIDLENFAKTLDRDLPDGYKILQYPSKLPELPTDE